VEIPAKMFFEYSSFLCIQKLIGWSLLPTSWALTVATSLLASSRKQAIGLAIARETCLQQNIMDSPFGGDGRRRLECRHNGGIARLGPFTTSSLFPAEDVFSGDQSPATVLFRSVVPRKRASMLSERPKSAEKETTNEPLTRRRTACVHSPRPVKSHQPRSFPVLNCRISCCLFLIAAMGLPAACPSMAMGQEKLSNFMRVKLNHAQKTLEGLSKADFDLIAKHSQTISLLCEDELWMVIQTAEYRERSKEFQRSVDAIRDAALNKNLEAATLAYVDATMKCVSCHKYMRRMGQPK
jgi:cytochrome c556